jgi:tRNA (guanosine-2'-O-)-methyltransferase
MTDIDLLTYLQTFITESRKETFERVLAERTKHFTVVLEDLYQKHNTGAVVRSCDVFGLQDAYFIENKYKSYLSNQVAKGAEKWIDFHVFKGEKDSSEKCVRTLRERGYQIIATTPHDDSCLLEDFDISKKSAFVLGVEKEGVSYYMMQQADGYLKIPMVGFTESLNVSVAAAIILHSVTTRLKKSDVKWQLTEDEMNEKRIDWCKKSIRSVNDVVKRFYGER